MKKTISLIMLSGALLVACKTKKNVAKTSPSGPSDTQLAAVKAKIPGTTMDDLKKGHNIYYGACTNCHSAKDVTGFSEDKLRKTIDAMAPKAALSEAEKDAVWKYALAVNLSSGK